jgi:choline dehydrogenase
MDPTGLHGLYLTNERSLFGAGSPEDVALYQDGRGPLTSNVAEGGVFLSTRGDESVPDCQFEMAPAMYFDEGLSAPFDHAFCIATTLLKPTSRGRVALRSARPDAKPRIYHNYLATDHDRATMIASVRLAMDIFGQPSLSKFQRAPFSVPASDAEADVVALSSSGQARTIIRRAPARSAASSTRISGFSAPKGCV